MKRLREIDALRGLAVLCMVLFHFSFDGLLLGLWEFEPYKMPMLLLVRLGQFLFLGLVGVSVFLSSRGFKEQVKRGAKIFLAGLLVSFATYLVFPGEYVRFGVLHLIGVSVPLLVIFKGREGWALVLAVLVYFSAGFLQESGLASAWLIPLGAPQNGFASLDCFPLLPWFSAPLVGLWVGSKLYAQRKETMLSVFAKVPALEWLGRHSLAVYLLHQPILYFSLWGLSFLFNRS